MKTPKSRCGKNKLRVHVKSTPSRRGHYKCVSDKGKPGRGPKLFTVKEGAMHPYRIRSIRSGIDKTKYLKTSTRRSLLRKVRGKSWTDKGRSLNALYVYNKLSNPRVAKIAKADSKFAFAQAKKKKSSERKKKSSERKKIAAPFPFNLLNF